MDKLKSAVGMSGKQEEGQEPVSGTKGEGTTAEPYDSGNNQNATQVADQTQDESEFDREHAYLSSAIDDADAARDADASKSEAPASTNANTAEEVKPAKEEKKGGGFLGAIGLGGGSKKKKKKDDDKDTAAGAEKAAVDKAEAEKHLPPNHLGSTVPEGASKDLADPGTVAPGQTDGLAQQKGAVPAVTTTTTNDNDADTPRSPSSAGKQPDRGGSVASSGGLSPDRARSAGSGTGANQLLGSRGEHRGSMIPADAPKYKRVENPDRIPIAGGKRIGEEQYQTRRASVAPSSSPPRDMQKLDREGSPDPVTATNTEANVAPKAAAAPVPEGKNTAPQQMKEFSMGDASKEAEAKPVGAGATEEVAPDEGKPAGGAAAAAATSSSPPTAGKENSATAGHGHSRRPSVFDRLKEKVKGSKK